MQNGSADRQEPGSKRRNGDQQQHGIGQIHAEQGVGRGKDISEYCPLHMHQNGDQLPSGDPIGPVPVAGKRKPPETSQHGEVDDEQFDIEAGPAETIGRKGGGQRSQNRGGDTLSLAGAAAPER